MNERLRKVALAAAISAAALSIGACQESIDQSPTPKAKDVPTITQIAENPNNRIGEAVIFTVLTAGVVAGGTLACRKKE